MCFLGKAWLSLSLPTLASDYSILISLTLKCIIRNDSNLVQHPPPPPPPNICLSLDFVPLPNGASWVPPVSQGPPVVVIEERLYFPVFYYCIFQSPPPPPPPPPRAVLPHLHPSSIHPLCASL